MWPDIPAEPQCFCQMMGVPTLVDNNLHAAFLPLSNETDDIDARHQIKGLVEVSLKGFGKDDASRHVHELQGCLALVEDV